MVLSYNKICTVTCFLESHPNMDSFYWSISLICIGMFVVLLELFVPSAGLLGVLAAVCLVAGIVIGFSTSVMTGVILLIMTMVIVPVMLGFMIKVWPSTPIGRRILIRPADSPDDVLPDSQYLNEIHEAVGQLGFAKTKMLPSGTVMVNGIKFDALSDGLPIDEGDAIKVVAVKGNRILVERYDGELSTSGDLPAADIDLLSQPIEELGLDALDDPLS